MIVIAYICAAFGLVLGVVGLAGAGVLLWRQLQSAPNGYEDAQGFHGEPRISCSLDRATSDRDQAFFTRHKFKP
jgi:hypothetical protein